MANGTTLGPPPGTHFRRYHDPTTRLEESAAPRGESPRPVQIGGLGAFGLTLDGLLRCQEAQAAPESSPRANLGKAKSCILLCLFGGASQLETFDPKPDALTEYRGELGSLPTSIPGIRIGELLPRTAKILDLTTVVRSMQHDLPIHPVGYVLTGIPASE